MKVLVTGGAGFIGSHIVDMLIEKGHDVVIVDSLVHGKEKNINKEAKFYNVDIRDKKIQDIFETEKPEVLIHEAAQIKVPSSIENPIYDAEVNIIGTLNLLEAGRKNGLKKVIYPASAAIFGEPKYLPIDEEHELNMISGYGVTKHTVEHYLKVYNTLYGMDYVVLRYANVYGPRQDSTGEGGVVAIFSERMNKDEDIYIYGDGEQIRDFVFVKDVARANMEAMEKNVCGIYNVCTGEKVSVNDLVKYINSILGKNIKPIYASEREGDIKNSYMSYEKIKKEFGWKPEYDMQSGLKETLNFYKKA